MASPTFYKIYTAKAPVNIAVIKYWGKSNEILKIPINDSLSGTLDMNEMSTTTSVAISNTYKDDEMWLNGVKQDLSGENCPARIILEEIRKLTDPSQPILQYHVRIVSTNNFPTAAGLASSAAGNACLAYVLGHVHGVTDLRDLSKLARRGSGSACRSLMGGFVQWIKGYDHNSSHAHQVVDQLHWPEMRVVICVISDGQKDVSSSAGMARSVLTSPLIQYRAIDIVPERIKLMKEAIIERDFESFSNLTMQDSNQFHSICLDTFPPLFYLNDASRQIIRICSIINSHYKRNKVAYTFDAGPNACIYLLEDFVPQFIGIMKKFFPISQVGDGDLRSLHVRGRSYAYPDVGELETICSEIATKGVQEKQDAVSYLINTGIGGGPLLVDEHIDDEKLKP